MLCEVSFPTVPLESKDIKFRQIKNIDWNMFRNDIAEIDLVKFPGCMITLGL